MTRGQHTITSNVYLSISNGPTIKSYVLAKVNKKGWEIPLKVLLC